MKLLPFLSSATFQAMKIADAFVTLPKSLGDSIHFRCSWKEFKFSKEAASKTLWIHGASVGELEDLANFFLDPNLVESSGYQYKEIIVTSSSVSAESFLRKIQNQIPIAYAGPLPPEDTKELSDFYATYKPELLVLSHSDLWPLALEIAQKEYLSKGIIWLPSHAESGKLLFEKIIKQSSLKKVCARNPIDQQLLEARLKDIFTNSEFVLLGNPRIDRIIQRINKQKELDAHRLESHRCAPETGKLSILLGSAWVEDAAILAEGLKALSAAEMAQIQIVVIPHVINNMHLTASIQHLLPMARVLSVEGALLEAYQDFDLAFVGGGFQTGLHSVLEPAIWGIPIICGPQLKKQPDAKNLMAKGALRSILSTQELSKILKASLAKEQDYVEWKSSALKSKDELLLLKGASEHLSSIISQAKLQVP